MKAGAKRMNAQIKLVRGEIRSRDKKQVATEPIFTSEPVMPKFVKKISLAASIWREYMQMGLGERILTEPDSRAFGMYCLMCAEIEAHIDSREPTDALTPPAAWLAQYRMYAELFGLVPAGRARIQEKPQKPHGLKEARAQSGTAATQGEDEEPNYFG